MRKRTASLFFLTVAIDDDVRTKQCGHSHQQ